MTLLSYLYPGQPADDRLAQYLAPDEHDKHERWLQAVQDRACPAALGTARQLVAALRAQADNTLRFSTDQMVAISGRAEVFDEHLRALFGAGLIAKRGMVGPYHAFMLSLF